MMIPMFYFVLFPLFILIITASINRDARPAWGTENLGAETVAEELVAVSFSSSSMGSPGMISTEDMIMSSTGWSLRRGRAFPQVSAPGVSVNTADLTLGGTNPDPYQTVTGTSFAAAHVSGVMALLLGDNAFPATSIPDLENSLQITATDLGALGADHDFGYGMVNAAAAAQELTNKPPLPATLLSPADGADGLETTVTFSWIHSTDPDGDQTTDTVAITEIAAAPALLGLSNSTLNNFPIWLAAFLLFGSSFFGFKRKRYLSGVCGLLALSTMLLSCGGGAGSASTDDSFTATGLKSSTTYSWKVVSTDSGGETTETAAWTFTTR
jgi:hypothetical protein